MFRQHFRRLSFRLVICAVAFVPAALRGAMAEDAPCRAHAVAPSLQMPGAAPAGIFTAGNLAILVDDAGEGRAVLACAMADDGSFHLIGSWPLPSTFSTQTIALKGWRLELFSADGDKYEQDISAVAGEQPEAPEAANAATPDGFPFSAEKAATGQLWLTIPLSLSHLEGTQKGELAYELKPIQPGAEIFTRKVLALDTAAGTATIYWEEVGERTRAFVIKVDRLGTILAGAEIPIDTLETVPERLAGVMSDGRAYYLSVKGGESVPVLLPLDPDFAKKGVEKGSLESPAASIAEQPSDTEFQEAVRKNTGDSKDDTEAPAPPVSRASVVECAEKFSTFKWTMTAGAYAHAGVGNICDPQAKYWLRPFHLKNTIGKEIAGVPYCWGCSDSLDRFAARVAAGTHLAGHSCTCRKGHYCLRSDAVGVDCSGFVSQCWKSGYYQTSRMSEIADTIDKRKLKPGDALNLSGSHIRLFIAFVAAPNGNKFRVIEAANSKGEVGRVIDATYTATQLGSYKAIRYRKITD